MNPLRSSLATFIALALLASTAVGQAPLPDGWQDLPADQFAAAAEEALASRPGAAVEGEVLRHAWQAFLTNETFVNTADLSLVDRLVKLLFERQHLLATGGTFAEREASQQQVNQQLATLNTRLAARLAGDGQLVTNASFSELKSLDEAMRVSGVPKAERAEHFVAWMSANDWQALSLADQGVLLGALDADRIDRSNMSIRWTGFVTAPTTGEYTFSQLAHYRQDAVMKVWVNEQPVLDSTPQPNATPDQLRQRFTGKPVTLTANHPASIRIEFSHNAERAVMTDIEAYPVAVLLWKSPADANQEPQIVPASALSPPEGVAGQAALQGEYFRSAGFQPADLVVTRLDGPIDFIWPGLDDFWTWRQVAPVHEAQWNAVYAATIGRLTEPTYIAGLSGAELQEMLLSGGRHVLGAARASQRIQILDNLLAQPEKLAALDAHLVGRIVKHTYMLPGDRHVKLIGTWGSSRPQPRAELGSMFGWEEGTYEWNNLQFYWHIGHFLTGDHFADALQLWEEYITKPGGECNLSVAYVTAWAAREEGKANLYTERIGEALENETLTGDQRLTWLLARSYGEGVMVDGPARPTRGMESLQEAMLVAQTDDYKFWALQEMVARLGSHGSAEEANTMLDQYADRFATAEQQGAIRAWQVKIGELDALYGRHRDDQKVAQQREQQAAYVATLRYRLANAQERGDTADAKRYQQLVDAAHAQAIGN
jgi:hypothetical protein